MPLFKPYDVRVFVDAYDVVDVAVHDPRLGDVADRTLVLGGEIDRYPWRFAGRGGRASDAVFADAATMGCRWYAMRDANPAERAAIEARPAQPGDVRRDPHVGHGVAVYSPFAGDLAHTQARPGHDWVVTTPHADVLGSTWVSEREVVHWTPMVPVDPAVFGHMAAVREMLLTESEAELAAVREVLSARGLLGDPEVPLATQVADVLDALRPPAPVAPQDRCPHIRTSRAFGRVSARFRCTLERGHPFDDPEGGEEHAVEVFPAAEYDMVLRDALGLVDRWLIIWDERHYRPLILATLLTPLDSEVAEQILCDAYIGGRPYHHLVDDPTIVDRVRCRTYAQELDGETIRGRRLVLTDAGRRFLTEDEETNADAG